MTTKDSNNAAPVTINNIECLHNSGDLARIQMHEQRMIAY
jgi:hypothetical protein